MTDGVPIVALDTNALMMPVELNVRTFDEIERLLGAAELVVPRAVLDELDRLASSGEGNEAKAANVGRELAETHCQPIEEKPGDADGVIAQLADEHAIDYVVTNDAPLRNRVLDAGIPVISLRGRTNLAIIQP